MEIQKSSVISVKKRATKLVLSVELKFDLVKTIYGVRSSRVWIEVYAIQQLCSKCLALWSGQHLSGRLP